MKTRMRDLLTVCLLWTSLGLASGKISDACHGKQDINQTSNLLECENDLVICIDEIRFYQQNPKSGCPHELSRPMQGCCEHNDRRCSWVRNNVSDTEDLQGQCMNRNRCKLHSPHPMPVAAPCTLSALAPVSSVRSITYTCRQSCIHQTMHQTTKMPESRSVTDNKSSSSFTTGDSGILPPPESTHGPRIDDPRIIVGGVIGGLVGCGLVFTLIILFKRRRASVNKPVASFPPPGVTDSVSFSDGYSTVDSLRRQPDVTREHEDKNGDSLRTITYSNPPMLNMLKEAAYDHIQGEVAQFPAHRDYDHVTLTDGDGRIAETSSGNTHEETYDRLDRGKRLPFVENKEGRYHALNEIKPKRYSYKC